MQPRFQIVSGLRLLAIGYLTLFLVVPLCAILAAAVKDEQGFTLKYVVNFFSSPELVRMSVRSVNAAILAAALASLIAVPLALTGAMLKFRFRRLYQFLLVAPLVLPPFVSALGFRKLFARFGPINSLLLALNIIDAPADLLGQGSLLGVAIVQSLHLFPIVALTVSAALASFDGTLIEAAALSGLSSFAIIRKIILPLLTPSIIAGVSIAFVWAITDVGTPLIFDYRETLAVYVFNSVGEIHTNPTGYVGVIFLMIISIGGFFVAKLMKSTNAVTGMRTIKPIHQRTLGFIGNSITTLALLLLAFAALLPHVMVITLALTEKWFMALLPQSFTVQHFIDAFSHPLTLRSIINSLGLSAVSTCIDLILGVTIAFALVRSRSLLNPLVEVLALVPLAVPGIVVAFGYLGAFSGTLIDPRTLPLLILAIGYSVRRLPFMLRTSRAGFEQSPLVFEEAAASVGATPALTLRRITLPILRPHLIAGAILCFTFAMLEVSESLILAQEEWAFPLTKAMYAVLGRPDGPYLSAALGVVGMIVMAIGLLVVKKMIGNKFTETFRV